MPLTWISNCFSDSNDYAYSPRIHFPLSLQTPKQGVCQRRYRDDRARGQQGTRFQGGEGGERDLFAEASRRGSSLAFADSLAVFTKRVPGSTNALSQPHRCPCDQMQRAWRMLCVSTVSAVKAPVPLRAQDDFDSPKFHCD
jgi:hypothetical protein